jgi:hypothetical protein
MPNLTTPRAEPHAQASGHRNTANLAAKSAPHPVWRTHLIVCLAYLLLAILLTWPTVTHLTTQLPGDGGDDPAIAWNLWWMKHALLDLKSNPLFSDYMFYPVGVNLAFYTLTVLNDLTALPLTLNTGVVAASNLHMLFTFVAGGYGAFLLVRQELGKATQPAIWAAALAGVIYAFASSKIFYVSLGQFNIASSHWIPFYVLFLIRTCRQPKSLRWPVMSALFLALQAWAEMTYASFLIIFTALYAVACTVSHLSKNRDTANAASSDTAAHQPRWWFQFARSLTLLALLFAIAIAPLLAAMMPDMLTHGDFWVEGSGFAEAFSADGLGFLLPTMHHPWLGHIVEGSNLLAYDKGQHIFLGFTLLALTAAGIVFGTRNGGRQSHGTAALWLFSAMFFGWLCLGPSLHFNGADIGIPGPFLIVQKLPFFKGNRYPSRYSVLLMLSLAVVAAYGVEAILRRMARRRHTARRGIALAGILLGTLFLAEHLAIPLPQSDMTVPGVYRTLAVRHTQGTLLDIPFAWRNGFRITGPIHPGFMFGQFYQTAHQRPMIQGNTSRNPEEKFQYFTEAPIINSLLALETGHQLPAGQLEADRQVAPQVMRFLNITTIVVRSGEGTSVPPNVVPEAAIPYIETVLPTTKIDESPNISAYAVNLPPMPSSVTINADAPLARLYLAEGWGPIPDVQGGCTTPAGDAPFKAGGERLLWAQQERVRLLVSTNGQTGELRWMAYAIDEAQVLTIRTATWRSDPVPLQAGWHEYSIPIPYGALSPGTRSLFFDFTTLYPTAAFAAHLSAPCQFSLVVTSAGQEVGDFGRIYVNGMDLSPNERGYNIAGIRSPADLRIEAFDTHLRPEASTELAAFMDQLSEEHIVAATAADEASMNLDAAAVSALHSVGSQADLRDKFRWSHAFIGAVGTNSPALEAESGIAPVTVALGPAITKPEAAAAFRWIRIETD